MFAILIIIFTWITQAGREPANIRFYGLVRPLLVEGLVEAVGRVCEFLRRRAAMYVVFFSLFFSLLMFSSADTRFWALAAQLWEEFCAGDFPQAKHTAGRLALVGGEVLFLWFAIRVLENMVCFFFILELELTCI